MEKYELLEFAKSFQCDPSEMEGFSVLGFWDMSESYSGHWYFLLEKDGQLFVNESSHCSCYGMEGQWGPEEVTPAQQLMVTIGWRWDGTQSEYTAELHEIVENWIKNHRPN